MFFKSTNLSSVLIIFFRLSNRTAIDLSPYNILSYVCSDDFNDSLKNSENILDFIFLAIFLTNTSSCDIDLPDNVIILSTASINGFVVDIKNDLKILRNVPISSLYPILSLAFSAKNVFSNKSLAFSNTFAASTSFICLTNCLCIITLLPNFLVSIRDAITKSPNGLA